MTRTAYILLGLIALLTLIFLANGHWLVSCPFHQLTGWKCPFCGGQRMIHALLHGNAKEAFLFNPFLFICSPFLLTWAIYSLFPNIFPTRFSFLFTDRTFFILLSAFVLWGIARNIYICI